MVQTIFTKSHIRKAFLALGPVSFIAGVSMAIGGILYENAAVAMAGYIVMLVSTILFSISGFMDSKRRKDGKFAIGGVFPIMDAIWGLLIIILGVLYGVHENDPIEWDAAAIIIAVGVSELLLPALIGIKTLHKYYVDNDSELIGDLAKCFVSLVSWISAAVLLYFGATSRAGSIVMSTLFLGHIYFFAESLFKMLIKRPEKGNEADRQEPARKQ